VDGAFAAGRVATLQLPPAGPTMIEALLEASTCTGSDCRATHADGFRIERFNDGRGGRLRLVSVDADGSETAGAWQSVAVGSDLVLALHASSEDADAPAWVLHATGAGLHWQLPLQAEAPAYRLRGSVPIRLSGQQP